MRNVNLHNSVKSKGENSDWSKAALTPNQEDNSSDKSLDRNDPRKLIVESGDRLWAAAQSEFSDSIFLSQQEVHSPPGCQ